MEAEPGEILIKCQLDAFLICDSFLKLSYGSEPFLNSDFFLFFRIIDEKQSNIEIKKQRQGRF